MSPSGHTSLSKFLKFGSYLSNICSSLSNNKGFAAGLPASLSMAVVVASVAGVATNSVLLDTEQKVHILNAQVLAKTTNQIILERRRPRAGDTISYSLEDLYKFAGLDPVLDPSSNQDTYAAEDSLVVIEPDINDYGQAIYKFYVKLANYDQTYIYTNETEFLPKYGIEAKNLTRDDIDIPSRVKQELDDFDL